MVKIIKASKGSPQELEMLVENRIAELEDRDITSSFVYPDDLEDLENGEYESHVTEPINCSAIVRPVGYKSWGVYLPDGHNHAEKLFESESEDECYDWINDNQKVIWEKEAAMNTVESASGSPQELQMLVENRLDRLESGVDASFVYPEDLIDLENGEYESHVTEPINAATDFKKLASDVLKFLANKGFDIASNSVRKYADAVAEYIEQAREHTNYSIEEWYNETKHNYPEDLRELPKVEAATTLYSLELDPEEEELLYEIAERYNTSTPVSGDWDTETEHEMHAIMDELDCDEHDAKWIMKQYLGFEDDMFACTAVESAVSDEFADRYKPSATFISEWLAEHEQAYSDVCDYFGCSIEEDVADYANADQLIDWISEHEWLSEDFSNYFGYEWIESCTNTANIMSGVDETVRKVGDYIRKVDEIIYPNLSDRYTCLNDVQAQYLPPKKVGNFDDGTFRVTISFVDDTNEPDYHIAFAFNTLPEDPSEAAYYIQNEIEASMGEELDDLENAFTSADWEV